MGEEQQALEGIKKALRLKRVNRQQMILRAVDVEKLIEPEHPARAIWELVGGLDLSAFRAEIAVVEGEAACDGEEWLWHYLNCARSARPTTWGRWICRCSKASACLWPRGNWWR